MDIYDGEMLMVAQPTHNAVTEEEYFELERENTQEGVKYELIGGVIYMMAGAKRRHVIINANMTTLVNLGLRGRDCETYPNDMQVKIAASGEYVYPDLVVACDQPKFEDEERENQLLNPLFIAEILSPSTEQKDRTVKFGAYTRIPSLRDYVLVAQDAPRVERFSRGEDDRWWVTIAAGLDAEIELPSIGLTLSLAEVYERVTFEAASDIGSDTLP
jgi:Uma2 family endonuclease